LFSIIRYISNNSFAGDVNEAVSAFATVSELVAANNSLYATQLAINSNFIRVLDLSYNSVGTLSGSSSTLQTLNLYRTGLSMALGSTLNSFPALKSANLADNSIVGTLPPTVPSTMEEIYLDANLLTGPVPSTFVSSSPVWKVISASQNGLSGSLPVTFFTSTPFLVQLNLANNSLSCIAYLPAALTTCDLSNNYLCPDIVSGTCVPSGSACFASASLCKPASDANSFCPAARPTQASVCNSATGNWELPYWHSPSLASNLTIFNGSLVFPAGPVPYQIRSLTVGFLPVNETYVAAKTSISFEANSDVEILGDFTIGAFVDVTVALPDAAKLDIFNANASAALPVVHTRGTWIVSNQNTTIIADVRNSLPADSMPALWFMTSTALNGSFASQDVLIPARLNATNQYNGFMCTGYFVFTTENSAYLSYQLVNSVDLCGTPARVIPPPLPPRGFDVGALIGSLFAVLVLAFVCFAAAMVANEDWHYVLPYND
jgi:hypothetical protein